MKFDNSTNASCVTVRGVFMVGVLLFGLLSLNSGSAFAQCSYTKAATYRGTADAEGWSQYDAGGGFTGYINGRGETDDPDGDGLSNRQEWEGWTTTINGVSTSFGWKTGDADGSCFDDADSDRDGVSDWLEREAGTDPRNGDTDGDNIPDAWEIRTGLDPRDDGSVDPLNGQHADPDGDGLTNYEECLGPDSSTFPVLPTASGSNHLTLNEFGVGNANYTFPLNFDSTADDLIDSFKYQWRGTLNVFAADDKDADLDEDGLTTYREQCVHPLLAPFWVSDGIPAAATFNPGITFAVSGYTIAGTRQGLMTPGYMNRASWDDTTLPNSELAGAQGSVVWGHPVTDGSYPYDPADLNSAVQRWTNPNSAYTGGNLNMLPDGWLVEHGLNPLDQSPVLANGLINPSGPFGDPDHDGLMNFEEYRGQDGFRIDYITGTGDETIPWISRVSNLKVDEPYGTRIGQQSSPSIGTDLDYQAPYNYLGVYSDLPIYSVMFDFAKFPGFFDPVAYDAFGILTPIPGVPPPVPIIDENDGLPQTFNPFATALAGFYFVDGDASGYYEVGEALWYEVDGDGLYTSGTDIYLSTAVVAPADGTAGVDITANISQKWPMPGYDSDDDGLSDALEIQADVASGKSPSSAVHPSDPFTPRSAKLTSETGISVPNPDSSEAGRRLFSRSFTVESWVFLNDQGTDLYNGAFIRGDMSLAPTLSRAAYQLGVSNSIPYVAFQTLGGKRYEVSAGSEMPRGEWVHLAGVFNFSENALSLYQNGLLMQSLQVLEESSSSTAIQLGGSVTLGINSQPSVTADFADNVWIDEVRIWGVPRTGTEIANNMSHLIDPFTITPTNIYDNAERNGLFVYYNFDDGGEQALDYTRRARTSFVGYDYPSDAGVVGAPGNDYLYLDRGFGLDSDALSLLKTPSANTFVFDANRVAPVSGMVDPERGSFDSVGDILPDAWKLVHEMNPFKISTPDHDQILLYDTDWAVGDGPMADALRDFDNDNLNVLYEYWARTNPRKLDTDANGIYDGDEDFDGDAVPNRVEQQLGSQPHLVDTDDDGTTDSQHFADGTSATDSLSPLKERLLQLDGNPGSFLLVPERPELMLNSWSIEAKVLPSSIDDFSDGQGATILRRAIQQADNGLWGTTFELRVVRDGTNLTAEVRYIYVDPSGNGNIVALKGDPADELARIPWASDEHDAYPYPDLVHVAASYDDLTSEMRLYLNGTMIASGASGASRPPISGRGPILHTRVGENFKGIIDDIRIWNTVRSASEIRDAIDTLPTGTETNLVAYFRLDDGGWAARTYTRGVLDVLSTPPGAPSEGDRYIVAPVATGDWVGQEGRIALFEDAEWVFEENSDGTRAYVTAASQDYELSGTTWTAVTDPEVIPSVRYAATPASPQESDTWLSGGQTYIYESGQSFSQPAPARLFSEGVMLSGSAVDGDFAWWASRSEFYRYDSSLGAWKRWGKAIPTLADARWAVEKVLPNTAALPATALVGDIYFEEATPSFQIWNGVSWEASSVNDGDRFIDLDTQRVYDWNTPNAGVNLIADANTDDGGLFITILDQGISFRSDGTDWLRWGYEPTLQDFTFPQNWTNQWDLAAVPQGNVDLLARANLVFDVEEADCNSDGIPDWWYTKYGFDPCGASVAENDDDGDGLINFWEYRVGGDPTEAYSLDPAARLTDAYFDSDGDGLSNIEEVDDFGTDPALEDTDDDGFGDGDELNSLVYCPTNGPDRRLVTDPTYSRSPMIQRGMELDGTEYVLPAMTTNGVDRFDLTKWSLQAWVNLASTNETGTVLKRETSMGYTNFFLGVRDNVPYAEYMNPAGQVVSVGGQKPLEPGSWYQLAAVWDPSIDSFSLFINGIAYQAQQTLRDCATGEGVTTMGTDLNGFIDDVRIWSVPISLNRPTAGGMVVSTGQMATNLFDALLGQPLPAGVTINSITYSGDETAAGTYRQFPSLPRGYTRPANGIILSSGDATIAENNYNTSPAATGSFGLAGDTDLDTLTGGYATYDACSLTINFTVDDTIDGFSFNLLFASEEFPEYVGSFNDAFGAFLDGTNVSFDALGNPVTVNNNFFELDNDPWYPDDPDAAGKRPVDVAFEYDGLTPLLVSAKGVTNGTHTLKLVIGDALDTVLDSAVFLSGLIFEYDTEGTSQALRPNGLEAWYIFDDGGTTAEDFMNLGDDDFVLPTTAFVTNCVPMPELLDDADGDDLPNWWEALLYEGDADPDVDSDGDGLNNLYEFYADTNPLDNDSDNNGQLDSIEDWDGDGLYNAREQDASSHPRLSDTDDDGIDDGVEFNDGTDPADGFDPYVERVLALDGTAGTYADVPSTDDPSRFALPTYTIEAWIYPTSGGTGGVILDREVAPDQKTFMLGLTPNVSGSFSPYIRVTPQTDTTYTGANDITVTAAPALAILPDQWHHIAATMNDDTGDLKLYVNGQYAGAAPVEDGVKTYGVGPDYTHMGEDFSGYIDEVRIWRLAKTANDILAGMHGMAEAGDYSSTATGEALLALRASLTNGVPGEFSLPVLNGVSRIGLVSYFRFDDGGVTAEDMTYYRDWLWQWTDAAVLKGAASMINASLWNSPLNGLDEDQDGDGIPDAWEITMFGDLTTADETTDYDQDGLLDYVEYLADTDPRAVDTDGDTIGDADEDSDGDSLINGDEQAAGTDPGNWDTDDDGVSDFDELTKDVNGLIQSPIYSMGQYVPVARCLNINTAGLPISGVVVPGTPDAMSQSTSEWTIESWFMSDQAAAQTGSLIRKVCGSRLAFDLGLENGVPYAAFQTEDGTTHKLTATGFTVADNTWTHLAAVWNATDYTLYLYIDGTMAFELELDADVDDSPVSGYGWTTLGTTASGWAAGSMVCLDNVRIWSRALTQYEVDEQRMTLLVPGSQSGLMSDFRFDDGGATVDDFAHYLMADDDEFVLNSAAYGLGADAQNNAVWLSTAARSFYGVDDSDSNHIPDWWQSVYGETEANGDTDGDGLGNLYEYFSHTNPDENDSDGNGFDDYNEDYDSDGLKNGEEQTYSSDPRYDDSDDDGETDAAEVRGTPARLVNQWPVSSPYSALQNDSTPANAQVLRRSMSLNGSSTLTLDGDAYAMKYALADWTISAWVNPSVASDALLISRSVEQPGVDGGTRLLINYELGLKEDGGALYPYVRYIGENVNGAPVEVRVDRNTPPADFGDLSIPLDTWTHVAGAYSSESNSLTLFINGVPVCDNAALDTTVAAPVAGRSRAVFTLGSGMSGYIDEVKLSGERLSDSALFQDYRSVSESAVGGYELGMGAAPGATSTVVQVAIEEAVAEEHAPSQLLLRFKGNVQETQRDTVINALGAEVEKVYRTLPIYLVNLPEGREMEAALQQFRDRDEILYAEPNYVLTATRTPNDADYDLLWGLNNTGQSGGIAGADISAEEAWDRTTGSRNVVVAVIDTGVDYNHEDLAANMWVNSGEIPGNGIDDDGNGYIDDVHGYDFYNNDGDPMDGDSHGTHCSGTIGGIGNNSIGVAGVNWNVSIMALKFLSDSGFGFTSDAIDAVEYAILMGAHISNNSWGGGGYSQALYDMIELAGQSGHTFVASAGNSGADSDVNPSYPAAYDLPNIISVAASDASDQLAYFSNYGRTSVDLAAPGVSIYSTEPGDTYGYKSGTSMAGPHVAGVCAMIKALNPNATYVSIKEAILNSVDRIDAFEGLLVTGGRLNAVNALSGSAAGQSSYFRMDDGGTYVEDMAVVNDVTENWRQALRLVGGAAFNSTTYAYMSGDDDDDGMPNWFETAYNVTDAIEDKDGEGLNNRSEYQAGTNPLLVDTLDDGVSDEQRDSDSDGLVNSIEQEIGSSLGLPDTDDDGITDAVELADFTMADRSVAPLVPRAVVLTGQTNPIELPHLEELALEDAWTVEAWIRPDTTETNGARIVERMVGSKGVNYELGVTGDGTNLYPYIRYANRSGQERIVTSDEAVLSERWTHIAGVYDTAQSKLILYVDGTLINYVETGLVQPASVEPCRVEGFIGDEFEGQIDEVRIWSLARAEDDLRTARYPALVGTELGLVSYFRFDDATSYAPPATGTSATTTELDRWNRGQIENFAGASTHDWYTDWFRGATMTDTVTFVEYSGLPGQETDEDEDGMADWWETLYFGNILVSDGTEDTDGDGLTDLYEYLAGTDPTNQYTFGGTARDDALDSDGDGLSNIKEQNQYNSDPGSTDTDDDGVTDGVEADKVSSLTHPMSVYSTNAALNNIAEPKSLVLADAPMGGIELPEPDRFAFINTNGWTVEAWTYLESDLSGDIFAFDGENGDSYVFGFTNGSPYAAVLNDAGDTVTYVGGERTGDTGIYPSPTNAWEHVAIAFSADDNTFRMYRQGILLIAQQTQYEMNFTHGRAFIGRNWEDGYLDEVRIWDSVRKRREIEEWYQRIYPAPGYVSDYDAEPYVPDPPARYNDQFYHVYAYDKMMLESYQPVYEYGQPLKAYYRFDDGGKFIEDFAYLGQKAYYLQGTVTNSVAYWPLGYDDADGDGLPEWWVNLHDLDRYRDEQIGPYHALEETGSDYPISIPNGWNTDEGDAGINYRVYMNNGYMTATNGDQIMVFNVWKDVDPDPLGTNGTARTTYRGQGVYDESWDIQIWADAGNWFTLDQTYGRNTVFYNDNNDSGDFDGGEDLWWDIGSVSQTYDVQDPIGIWFYRNFVSYGSLGAGWLWWEDEQYISTKDTSVGADGMYAAFTKYIYLDGAPSTASMDFHIFGVDSYELYINGDLYQTDTTTSTNDLVSFLHQGRNSVYLETDNAVIQTVTEIGVHYDLDYDRENTAMKFDMSMTVDGEQVIKRGDESIADPKAAWHGEAWSQYYNDHVAGVKPRPDLDGYGQKHADYAIPLDPDADDLNDYYEFWTQTNPRDEDTDNDGINDNEEDPDQDMLINSEEQTLASYPKLSDSDDDGILDGDDDDVQPANSVVPSLDRKLQLDGSMDSYVDMPVQSRFALDSFTVQAWVMPNAAAGNILARKVEDGVYNYSLTLLANSTIELRFTPADRSADVVLTSPQALSLNDWTHVSGTFDVASGRLSLFINGQLVSSVYTARRPAVTGAGPTWTHLGQGFNGEIDEVCLLSRAVTDAEIVAMLEGVASGTYSNMVAYYRFDDGTSASAAAADGRHYGTSGKDRWYWGQVEDFSGYYNDWLDAWYNAATLIGNANMVLCDADDPVSLSTKDTNGDGLPDWWHEYYGVDLNDDDVANEDWDNDGLSNLAEFLAGTDPNNPDTDGDGISDYDDRMGLNRTNGELYMDGDGMDDGWEAGYDSLSPELYDANEDPDNDGWDNYSEFMAEQTVVTTNGTFIVAHTNPEDAAEYPTPTVEFNVDYDGDYTGDLIIECFSSPEMDGEPDARYEETDVSVFMHSTSVVSFAEGYLRQGDNYFFAYLDLDSDGAWDEGEPAGLANGQPVDVGYDSVTVDIGLTDNEAPYMKRFEWTADDTVNAYTVRVSYVSHDLSPQILERVVEPPRNYLHEGDFLAAGIESLEPGTYRWHVGAESEVFNIEYGAMTNAPVPVQPLGQTLRRPMLEMKWTMSPAADKFRVQIARDTAFNQIVFTELTTNSHQNEDGEVTYQPPVYLGDGAFTNGVYYWRVWGVNSFGSSPWSPTRGFVVNIEKDSAYTHTISGFAQYFGKISNATVRAEVFENAAFSGKPVARVSQPLAGGAQLFDAAGLDSGTYYLRAFLDQNGDGLRSSLESWGFAKLTTSDYAVQPLTVPPNQNNVRVVIRDVDTDNDDVPDAWEVERFGDITLYQGMDQYPGTTNNATVLDVYETNHFYPEQDYDQDGLNDYVEICYDDTLAGREWNPNNYDPYDPVANPYGVDLDAERADTDRDGISDYDELMVYHTDPLDENGDKDLDGVSDGMEVARGMNLALADSDGDGFDDAVELVVGTDATRADSVPLAEQKNVFEFLRLTFQDGKPVVEYEVNPAIDTLQQSIELWIDTSCGLTSNWQAATEGTMDAQKSARTMEPEDTGTIMVYESPSSCSMGFYRIRWRIKNN